MNPILSTKYFDCMDPDGNKSIIFCCLKFKIKFWSCFAKKKDLFDFYFRITGCSSHLRKIF